MIRRANPQFLQATFVGLLILYLLAGVKLAPFHGDESTIIHKSRDWFLLTEGNLSALLFSPTPVDPAAQAEQELRLVNGVVPEYSVGLLASLSGLGLRDLPEQWLWGADWDYNLANGHMPGDQLLFIGRLASALLTAISVALVFTIARRLAGPRSAYLATTLYTLMPPVLLNGRRAMFEGATLLAVSLLLAAGLAVATYLNDAIGHAHWRRWFALGLAAGFGMASKHILIVTIIPIFVALIFLGRRSLTRTLAYSYLAGIVAIMLFLMLNPTWWSAPLSVPAEVLSLRTQLATGQLEHYGGYSNLTDRLTALWTQVMAAPQYYEDTADWLTWIGGQISAYEASGLQGLVWNPVSATVLFILSIVGCILASISAAAALRPMWIVFGWVLIFSLFAIFALTPLSWQRYYLPLAAPLAVAYGIGLMELWRRSRVALRASHVR